MPLQHDRLHARHVLVVGEYLYFAAFGVDLEDVGRRQVSRAQGLDHQTLGALLTKHVDTSLTSVPDALMEQKRLRSPRAHNRTLDDRGEAIGVQATKCRAYRVRLVGRNLRSRPSVSGPHGKTPDVPPDVENPRWGRELKARNVVRAA